MIRCRTPQPQPAKHLLPTQWKQRTTTTTATNTQGGEVRQRHTNTTVHKHGQHERGRDEENIKQPQWGRRAKENNITNTEKKRHHNRRKANNQPPTNTANTVTNNTIQQPHRSVTRTQQTTSTHSITKIPRNRRQRQTVPLLMVTNNRKWIDSL